MSSILMGTIQPLSIQPSTSVILSNTMEDILNSGRLSKEQQTIIRLEVNQQIKQLQYELEIAKKDIELEKLRKDSRKMRKEFTFWELFDSSTKYKSLKDKDI